MRFLGILILSIFSVCLSAAMPVSDEQVDSLLNATGIPVLHVTTVDGNEPVSVSVYPPANCWGIGTRDNDYLYVRLVITISGDVIYDSGEYGAEIKIRGNTSANSIKKPYKLKLDDDADLLFRGDKFYEAEDWALLPANGERFKNTVAGFAVAEFCDNGWQPQCRPVNLVVNGTYRGFYLLADAVERGYSRVNISEHGYLFEDDAYWWNEPLYLKGEILPYPVGFTFKYPAPDDITDEELNTLARKIYNFERCLLVHGEIENYIDIESFARWMLIHDIMGTGDSGGTNRFLYMNDQNSPMKMGISWDFDAAFKNVGRFGSIHDVDYSFYYSQLLDFENFKEAYYNAWSMVCESLHRRVTDYFDDIAAEHAEGIEISKLLDSRRWGWSNPTFEEDIALIDDWFSERIPWLNKRIENVETSLDIIRQEPENTSLVISDIYGRRLYEVSSPGIYIINGKKVLLRNQSDIRKLHSR